MGLSCLTLIIGRFSRYYRELRFKNTMIPLPYAQKPGEPGYVEGIRGGLMISDDLGESLR